MGSALPVEKNKKIEKNETFWVKNSILFSL